MEATVLKGMSPSAGPSLRTSSSLHHSSFRAIMGIPLSLYRPSKLRQMVSELFPPKPQVSTIEQVIDVIRIYHTPPVVHRPNSRLDGKSGHSDGWVVTITTRNLSDIVLQVPTLDLASNLPAFSLPMGQRCMPRLGQSREVSPRCRRSTRS